MKKKIKEHAIIDFMPILREVDEHLAQGLTLEESLKYNVVYSNILVEADGTEYILTLA